MSRPTIERIQSKPPPDSEKAEFWLRGHLGHLSEEEQKAFTSFKDISEKGGFYKPATATSKASHDDATLIRYVRARRFVPQDAFAQFKDTELWRKENNLDALYEKIDIKDYQESRSVYPQWTGRRDKRGIPVYLYEVGKLDSKKMLAYTSSTSTAKDKGSSSARMLRLFALYENLTRFVMPLCTAAPGRPHDETPVDQSNNIVDISRVGLKQFWNLKSHMQDASQLATAHYPETLDRIFILGAPPFFPTVWAWIKRWFDPITTSKIFVLSKPQILPTLTKFIDIENIPEKYGGQLKFECGDLPNLDPDLRSYLTIQTGQETERYFLTAPVRWLDVGVDGEMKAIGVGSIDGKQRNEHMATLHGLASRVATHRERLSRAPTKQSIAPSVTPSAVSSNATRSDTKHYSSPLAQNAAIVPPEGTDQPAAIGVHGATPAEKPATAGQAPQSITGNAQNGAPPEEISIPPPPVQLGRQPTEYLTPPTEPGGAKVLA